MYRLAEPDLWKGRLDSETDSRHLDISNCKIWRFN